VVFPNIRAGTSSPRRRLKEHNATTTSTATADASAQDNDDSSSVDSLDMSSVESLDSYLSDDASDYSITNKDKVNAATAITSTDQRKHKDKGTNSSSNASKKKKVVLTEEDIKVAALESVRNLYDTTDPTNPWNRYVAYKEDILLHDDAKDRKLAYYRHLGFGGRYFTPGQILAAKRKEKAIQLGLIPDNKQAGKEVVSRTTTTTTSSGSKGTTSATNATTASSKDHTQQRTIAKVDSHIQLPKIITAMKS
jgi:hypothetical protein